MTQQLVLLATYWTVWFIDDIYSKENIHKSSLLHGQEHKYINHMKQKNSREYLKAALILAPQT